MNRATQPLLKISNLTATYRNRRSPVLSGINFDLREGETCGLSGDSGCGKTTLAYALIRLLPKSACLTGAIYFRGRNLMTVPQRKLRFIRGRQIALVSQDPEQALSPVLRAGSQVEDVLRSHGSLSGRACRKRAEELLDSVGLADSGLFSAYAHEMSGGQRQRIVLAQALAGNPQLVIADEPASALDPGSQSTVLRLLSDLRREMNLTLLLITHDTRLLSQVADRMMVMEGGRLFACSSDSFAS